MAENHEVGQGLDDTSSGANGVDAEVQESIGEESSGMDELFLSPDDSEGEEIPLGESSDDAPADEQPSGGEADAEPAAAPEGGPPPADDQSAVTIRELEEQIEEIAAERDDVKNRMMRVAADLENFRKRTAREKQELRKYGIDKVVLELLPVLDNLERALEHSDKSEDKTTIVDGVRMVQKQFIGALQKHGVKGFDSVGDKFDPQKHEAIQQVETSDEETGTILEEYQKGYYLHERLIRPALVVVARNVGGEAASEDDGETDADEGDDDASISAEVEIEIEASEDHVGDVADTEANADDEHEEGPGDEEDSPDDEDSTVS